MRGAITYLTTVLAVSFVSCEKVIDIPLREADRRIVVEMEVMSDPGANYLSLTKTGSVYDVSNFDAISGASVSVTDQNGTVYVLNEIPGEPGKYTNPLLASEENSIYTMSISTESELITASSSTQSMPVIDEIFQQTLPNIFGQISGSEEDSLIIVVYEFTDPAEEVNYYLRRAWLNSETQIYRSVFHDNLWNGETVQGGMWEVEVVAGDTVHIDLLSIDFDTYRFYLTLDENSTSSASPANPESNLEGNAIGYFGAFLRDTASHIITE